MNLRGILLHQRIGDILIGVLSFELLYDLAYLTRQLGYFNMSLPTRRAIEDLVNQTPLNVPILVAASILETFLRCVITLLITWRLFRWLHPEVDATPRA